MITAIAYLRTSTRDQQLGMDAQRADVSAWAARHGVSVVGWHEDRVSGTAPLEDRPGLLAALAQVKAEKAGILLLQKRDRLARDAVEAGLIERAVGKLGAELRCADGANEPATPTTKLVSGILDSVAAFEGAQIRGRIKAALREKKARGEKLGGQCPYGYRLAEDRVHLEPLPPEQATLATMRELRTRGLSLRAVVGELQRAGVTSRAGKPFALTQVARLLAS